MKSFTKRSRRKTQREAAREKRQRDPVSDGEVEETEIVFRSGESPTDPPSPVPRSPQDSPSALADLQYEDVLDMVQRLHKELGLITLDNDKIMSVCNQLLKDNQARDRAIGDLTGPVERSLDRSAVQRPRPDAATKHPIIQHDLIDNEGNIHATDIGITWEGSDTFLHGVRVVGPGAAELPGRHRPSTSTPYQPVREHIACDMSTPRQPLVRPACLEVPDTPLHRVGQEGSQSYRPVAPIQRFNNKSLNWPAWFRHFRAVADVHGWDKNQRALQMVSYLDETAMNVAQELGDDELYDYDIMVKLLGDRFDPASRVSASRSRFDGRSRRHHEDADSFADAITELCHVGYPQSSPELRQELISEQFVRGQSDPELKKYLWVVIRTQKDRKLQTLIEVCMDFASLSPSVNIYRLVEQVFAVEEDDDSEEMFAMMDRSQWTGQGVSEPAIPPSLAQMFALAGRMGYEMRPIARQTNQPPGSPRTPFASGEGYRQPFRQGRDFSKVTRFSCSQMGHTQARCPKPVSALPFKPPGWNMQSDGQQRRNNNLPPGNAI